MQDTGFKFCGVDTEASNLFGAPQCKWQMKNVAWTIVNGVPNMSDFELKQAYTLAWSYWEEVCGIKARYVEDPRQANIIMGSGRIDGPGGTLAWSEMPCSRNVRQLQQKYDTGERRWVASQNPPRGTLDIVRVAAHEIGHAIGIPHIANGNLLAPTYSAFVRKPQSGDIREAQARYGKPDLPPVPPVDPIPDPVPDPKPNPTPTPKPDNNFWQKLLEALLGWLLNRFKSKK